ncbi:MAG: beta strand repeat-containing protein [Phycisphaerae bacterium]
MLPRNIALPFQNGWIHRKVVAGALAATALWASQAFAATDTWTGAGGDNNWTTAANWGGAVPAATDTLVFSGSTRLNPNNNFANGTSFGNLIFNGGSGAFSITGNRITLLGTIINNSSTLQTLNTDITLTSTAPTFTGGSGGIALGGTIDLNGFDPTFSNTSLLLVSGLITDNSSTPGTTTLNLGGGTSSLAGSISDGLFGRSVAVFNTQNGTAALTGFNAYSGGTIIDSGVLQINSNTALGSAAGFTTISHGTLEVLANSGDVVEGLRNYQLGANDSGIRVDAGASYEIDGAVADWTSPGSLNVAGGGTLILSGTNSYTGATNVNGGTLVLNSSIASTTAVSLSNGGTIVFSDTNTANNFGSGTTITVNAGGGTLQYGSTAATSGLTSSNRVVINAGATLTIQDNDSGTSKVTYVNNATFSGAGDLVIENVGSWPQDTYQMGGNNSGFTGNITVPAPGGVGIRLQPTSGSNNSLGSGAVTIADGSEIFFSTTNVVYSNTFNIAGIGTIVDNPPLGVIRMANGQTLSGTINLTGDATMTVGTSASNSGILTGRITGAAALTLASGTFTLNNTTGIASSYGSGAVGAPATIAGIVNNRAGTIVVGNFNSLSTGGVQLQGGTLDLNGLNITVANLSSTAANGTISGGNAGMAPFAAPPATTALLTFGADGSSLSFGGTLVDGNGKLSINKTGGGTSTFTGASTYTGTTAISAGELDLAAPASLASTAITVAPGATLAVAAGATIPAATVLSDNGTVKLNAPSVNIATLSGNGGVLFLHTTNLSISAGGAYDGVITDSGSGGALTLHGFLVTDGVQVATLNLNANQQIRANGGESGTSKVNALNLLGSTGNWLTGLDLTNNNLIVEDALSKAATIARLQDQVNYGGAHAAGIYTSAGLPANMTIAVVDNAAAGLSTFGGLSVDANSILVGAELFGDANIDGKVDLTDLSTVLNHFGTPSTAWTDGNFDGAASIDLTDLSFVLNNFGTTTPTPGLSAGPSIAAPEPASLAVAVPGLLLLRRRSPSRRRTAGAGR